MKFLLKATSLNNIAVRTALLILHDERISLCDSVSVDIDCSLRTFCYININILLHQQNEMMN